MVGTIRGFGLQKFFFEFRVTWFWGMAALNTVARDEARGGHIVLAELCNVLCVNRD